MGAGIHPGIQARRILLDDDQLGVAGNPDQAALHSVAFRLPGAGQRFEIYPLDGQETPRA
jgi:hypothetical protein